MLSSGHHTYHPTEGGSLVHRLMPGTKWKKSLKRPAMYKKLRRHGMPKSKAAAISNKAAKPNAVYKGKS